MADYNRPQLIEECLQLLIGEGNDLTYVRKELELKGVDEAERKEVMRFVSDQLMKHDALKAQRNVAWFVIGSGIVATLFGLIVTIGSYSGYINMGRGFMILYGPIIAGVAAIGWGFAQINNYNHFIIRNKIKLK